LKSIDDHQQWDYTHLTQEQPALKNEAAFRTKIHTQKKWPVPRCIALSTKLHYNYFLQVTSNNLGDQDLKEVGSRRLGGRSESMIQSFLCFFGCSLFSCSRTTVTATWNARG
jgi:hypothetical protein